MKKSEATNTFQDGMVMDFNPLVTPNNVVTSCLNGTLITYNGNENVLLNDMGNGRVETAYLPEGYIPLGTAELGGIVYIVSYNPILGKSLIGSFPSPERIQSSDELYDGLDKSLKDTDFFEQKSIGETSYTFIKNPLYKLTLFDKEINPGDKFLIFSPNLYNYRSEISAWNSPNKDINELPKYLKLHIVSVDQQGKITFLDDNLLWHEQKNGSYYIKPIASSLSDETNKPELEEYRNTYGDPNYNVFVAKSKGTLAILAELECIDSFSVTWDANISDTDLGKKAAEISFNLNWTYLNDNPESVSQINLNKILVTREMGEKEIVLKAEDVPLPTTARKNDGTDSDLKIGGIETVEYTIDSESDTIRKYTVIPGMPFGYMDYFKKEFSINFNKLGTGEVELKEWRYLVNEKDILLNWALDCYPEKNKAVTDVIFNFFELDDTFTFEKGIDLDSTKYFLQDQIEEITSSSALEYKIDHPNKSSYSGNSMDTIIFSEDSLLKNKCYLVRIQIDYKDKSGKNNPRYYYRFLYTTPIFNSIYYDFEHHPDFGQCLLGDFVNTTLLQTENTPVWTDTSISYESRSLTNPPSGDYNKDKLDTVFYQNSTEHDSRLIDEAHLAINSKYKIRTNNPLDTGESKLFNTLAFLFTTTKLYQLPILVSPSISYMTSFEDLDPISHTCEAFESASSTDIRRVDFKEYESGTIEEIITSTENGTVQNIKLEGLMKIYTPFKSFFKNLKSTDIDYELKKINIVTKSLTFNARRNGFGGGNNPFPENDEDNTIKSIEMSYSREAKSLTDKNEDIIKHAWLIGSLHKVDSMEARFYTQKKDVPNGTDRYGDGSSYSENEGDTLFFTYLIKGLDFANFILLLPPWDLKSNWPVFSNNPIILPYLREKDEKDKDLTNTKNNINNLYKWIKSSSKQNLFTLNNLVFYNSYIFSNTFSTNKAYKINSYNIGTWKHTINWQNTKGELSLPKNLLLKTTGTSEIEIETGKYRVNTNNILAKLNLQEFITYLLPEGNIVSSGYDIHLPYYKDSSEYRPKPLLYLLGRSLPLLVNDGQLIATNRIDDATQTNAYWKKNGVKVEGIRYLGLVKLLSVYDDHGTGYWFYNFLI